MKAWVSQTLIVVIIPKKLVLRIRVAVWFSRVEIPLVLVSAINLREFTDKLRLKLRISRKLRLYSASN